MAYKDKVKWLLEKNGLSNKDLAEIAEVSPGHISNIISGNRQFSRDTEEILIAKLKLPRDFFVDESLKTVTIDESTVFSQLFPESVGTVVTLERVRKLIQVFKDSN